MSKLTENQGTSRNHKNEQDHTRTISDDGWTQSSTLTTPERCWRITKPKNWGVSTVIGPGIFSTGRNSCQTPQALFVGGSWSDCFVTKYRERLFRYPADKTRGKMWGGRNAFCSIALPHLFCPLESPNTQCILHVSGAYSLHLHLLKSCIVVAQRGWHKEIVGDERTVLWKQETLISISAISTSGRKEKRESKPPNPTLNLHLFSQAGSLEVDKLRSTLFWSKLFWKQFPVASPSLLCWWQPFGSMLAHVWSSLNKFWPSFIPSAHQAS